MASEIVFGFKFRKIVVIDTGCSDSSEELHQAASADRVGRQTPAWADRRQRGQTDASVGRQTPAWADRRQRGQTDASGPLLGTS